MKVRHPSKRITEKGYASMAIVAVVAMVTLLGLMMTYRGAVASHDAQSRSQIRIDITQKEDALLRSLIAIVPNKAIDVMRDDSRSRASSLTWETIFAEAIEMAGAEQAVSAAMLMDMGLSDAIVANPADGAVHKVVKPLLGKTGVVNGGHSGNAGLALETRFAERLPDLLETSLEVQVEDDKYPVISREKTFSSAYNTEADLSVSDWPLYNRIRFPDIPFAYVPPGEPFIAKRNWWAFQVTFGQVGGGQDPKLPTLTRQYVLSIYEMPSQLPISAESFMAVGRHRDGTVWNNIAIDGGISAGVLSTEAALDLPTGTFSGRRGMLLTGGAVASGQSIRSDFDELGVRESIYAQSDRDTYGASLAANSGRVAFVPLNRGLDFYQLPVLTEGNTISPTGWDSYSTGAAQCRMKVIVTRVQAADNQTPTSLEWHFRSGGVETVLELDRGFNWPTGSEPGGELVPFQTEHLETGRKALVCYPERMPAFLLGELGDSVAVNNSLLVTVDPLQDVDIKAPEFPTVGTDLALVLRESGDLSGYTSGFSLVSNLRLYIADDFNTVAVAPPAGAGLSGSTPFYPPVSLFAPEVRYGTTLKIRPVDYKGQLSTLATGNAYAAYPLDLKAGTFETVNGPNIKADLKMIESPAELPPIYLMNWLVTVEEVF